MSQQIPRVARIVADSGINPNVGVTDIVLRNADGSAASTIIKQAAQADTTAADLAALKVDFNALLAKLRSANILS